MCFYTQADMCRIGTPLKATMLIGVAGKLPNPPGEVAKSGVVNNFPPC